jgi:primosomal protein N' (replication factor Y)
MSSAELSPSPIELSGPVSVCVDRPVLSLDRAFTYDLAPGMGAGIGSLVQVPFHGRPVRGWILGPTREVPARMLAVTKLVSPVRFFDEQLLEVLRWVSERYVASLASVIGRTYPPRVASEEVGGAALGAAGRDAAPRDPAPPGDAGRLDSYRGGPALLKALDGGAGAFVLRPAPEDEQRVVVEAVDATLGSGRSAIVLVPELEPLPATAAAVLDAFGGRAVLFAGGSRRDRYRTWLDIASAMYDVVVGTRPAVFAPCRQLGLVYVSRESHAGHREERSPYYHVRDVGVARARIAEAVCVAEAICPTTEVASLGMPEVAPDGRWWPPVEVVKPGPEGRAPRLVSALRAARRAFVYSPLPGAGIARMCRSCGEPAACAACGGVLRAVEGAVLCAVCGADGRCARCGSTAFRVAPGGAERVEQWAARAAGVPVRRVRGDGEVSPPASGGEVVVGGLEAVKDFGSLGLDLVGILDADLAARRPGLSSQERSLASWMEAAGWASPSGRVIVQTRSPNDPAVQALVAGNPVRFHRAETRRRAQAGFPPGCAVFRVVGTAELSTEVARLRAITSLVTELRGETICLLALDPVDVPAFGRTMRALAERGVVGRVEAEPHL